MRIRGTIIDKIRSQDWVPRSTRKKIKEIKLMAEKLKQSLGRAATTTELAAAMNMEKRKSGSSSGRRNAGRFYL